MTTAQYKNLILGTLKDIPDEKLSDHLYVTSEIFNNMGIAFPKATCEEILYTLLSGNYMGWVECTAAEAQTMANNGIPTVAVSMNEAKVVEPEYNTTLAASTLSVDNNSTENVLTLSNASVQEHITYSYFSYSNTHQEKIPPIPTRIAQNSTDSQWDVSLWTPYQNYAPTGCADACIAMALSCIGFDKKPSDIIRIMGGTSYISNWNLKEVDSTLSSVTYTRKDNLSGIVSALSNYQTNFQHYAPPIVCVHPKSNPSGIHYIVVCGYDSSTGTFHAVDPGIHGTNYYYWDSSDIAGQVIQYNI